MAVDAVVSAIERASAHVVALAIGMAAVHLLADDLPLDGPVSRNHLLSAAGGASVAYVFVYLLPTLDDRAELIEGVDLAVGSLLAQHVYLVAFVGLAVFYGLERLAQVSRTHEIDFAPGAVANEPVFWVHVGSFCLYNAFIGYVLVAGEPTGGPTAYAVAMALHLLGNDEAMRNHHREAYHRYGRWALAVAVLFGASAGYVVQFDDSTLTVVIALLTGGIVFNAIKEELPSDRDAQFWAFAVGAGGYGLLLAAIA